MLQAALHTERSPREMCASGQRRLRLAALAQTSKGANPGRVGAPTGAAAALWSARGVGERAAGSNHVVAGACAACQRSGSRAGSCSGVVVGRRVRTSVKYAHGSTPSRRQVDVKVYK